MRGFTKTTVVNPKYLKLIEWTKLISITGSAQVIIQITGFISGLIIIRLLPTRDYALYTLATTMIGTMVMLADAGVSTGVFSQAGKVWKDPNKLGSVLATGIGLRNRMALICATVSTPIFFYLFYRHNISWQVSVFIVTSILLVFNATISGTIINYPLVLWQDLKSSLVIQVLSNVGRMFLTMALFIFPWASLALIASYIPQTIANNKTKKKSEKYADYSQPADPAVKKEVVSVIKKMLPNAIYYSISGQITIWIISFYGSTTAVAQVGALGRLAVILTIVTVLFNTLVIPRIARMSSNPSLLMTRFVQIQACLLILCLIIMGLIWKFPTEILWILGNNYSGLHNELFLTVMASCLSLFSAFALSFCASKGWAISPLIYIPVSIVTIFLGVVIFQISTIEGVLKYNIFTTIVQVGLFMCYTLLKISKSMKAPDVYVG